MSRGPSSRCDAGVKARGWKLRIKSQVRAAFSNASHADTLAAANAPPQVAYRDDPVLAVADTYCA